MNKRKGFLINTAKPHLAPSEVFEVRESAVVLTANITGGVQKRFSLQVWVGRPDLGDWVTLYRRGEPVELVLDANVHVELVPGRYRVVYVGADGSVWFEETDQKPYMTYEKGRQQSRNTGLVADAEYGGITVEDDGATIRVTDDNYGSVQVTNSGQTWTVTGDDVAEPVNILTNIAGVVNIACDRGDYFTLLLGANVTSITFTDPPAAGFAQTVMVRITQDPATPRTVTWPASFVWAGGTAGTVTASTNAVDLLALTTFDQGTTWFATLATDWS